MARDVDDLADQEGHAVVGVAEPDTPATPTTHAHRRTR
jgi:hypothetical protein